MKIILLVSQSINLFYYPVNKIQENLRKKKQSQTKSLTLQIQVSFNWKKSNTLRLKTKYFNNYVIYFFIQTLLAAYVAADVSHILPKEEHLEYTTLSPPHRPYVFSYTAGRYKDHVDRTHR